jgi:hypothetical protein
MNKTRIAIILCIAITGLFLLPASQADTKKSSSNQLTFTKDIAPIFFKQCAECHRAGEAAPFSVMSYKDVRPWAKSIKEKVAKREMPPWSADPHVGEWTNDRRLSQADIDAIVAWVDGGANEGNPKDLPPAPKFAEGWSIGKPDVIIPMPKPYTLKPNGPDEIQYFEVDPGFKDDVYVQLAEARPGNRRIVHHIIAFIKPPAPQGQQGQQAQQKMSEEEVKKMREEMEKKLIFFQDGPLTKVKADVPVYDDACGSPSGGAGIFRDGTGSDGDGMLLCGYAPGMNQANWPAGTVKKVPAGSKLVFQLHYSTFLGVTNEEKDQSSVGLVFAKTPPTQELKTHGIANHYFKIPAGAENHTSTACWTAKEDIHIVTFMPHLHMRGKSMEFKAIYPDGRSEVVCNVPKYDFNWQIVYYAKKPVAIPKGTKILVTTVWDNSSKNKFNPDPKKDVRWGDPTYEEMTIGWIDYTVDGKGVKNSTAMNR